MVAVLVFGANGGGTPSAYASAPPGTYVVAALAGAEQDSILVVNTADPSVQFHVAGIAHAPEIPTIGSVSPNGQLLALIVVEPGAPSEAVAGLHIVDLETGSDVVALAPVDALQEPVWASDSASVVVVRSRPGTSIGVNVEMVNVTVGGGDHLLWTVQDTIAAYPVGFDAAGELVAVRLDGNGTAVVRGDGTRIAVSPYFSRDWKLSTDGSAIAFIESNQATGLRYIPRIVVLTGGGGGVSAQAVNDGQALGTAWAPASPTATFGYEPGNESGGVSAQSSAGGFDVPLEYSPDGDALAAWHWSGNSFENPGARSLIVDASHGRSTLTGVNRFFGWAAR